MSKHAHEWQEAQIANGSKTKKAQKYSDGAICKDCKLTAKAPSKMITGWLKGLPKS